MELQKHLPGVSRLSSPVGADVWRERNKELQDWIESMSGALPRLASTDKDERSLVRWLCKQKVSKSRTDAGEIEQPLCT